MKKLSLAALFMSLLLASSAFAQDDKPRLGLNVSALRADPLLLQHLRLSEGEGLMVSNVAVGGALEAAGLSQGDIVLAIDGRPLSRPADLQDYVETLPTGAKIMLDVIQKGEHKQIAMTLDRLPDDIVWKYAQPVTPGRSSMRRIAPLILRPSLPQVPNAQAGTTGAQVSQGQQKMTFKSIMSTQEGIKSSTVVITGSPQEPDSELEITLGSDTYKTRIGDLEQLPEDAQRAAQNAIKQAGQFSFSMHVDGSSMFEDMMKRHQAQMRLLDEAFFGNMGGQMAAPSTVPENNVLRPVEPKADDLQM